MIGRRGFGVLVLGTLAGGLAGCGVLEDDVETPAATVVAARADFEVSVPAHGVLTALNASPIAVPRVPTGALKIKELAPEGSLVEPGDVVLVFDDTQLNIELDNHKASFRSSNRQIDRTQLQSTIESGTIEVMKQVAEIERDNSEIFEIVDDTIYSRQEILETEVRREEASETIVFADASLLLRGEYYDIEESILSVEKDQVQGRIDRTETSLGSLVLKAPIAGLIVYRKNWLGASAEVGDTIFPGNVVLSIVDPADTSLSAFLLEKDAAGVQAGAPATVRIDARPDRVFHGKVHTIAELSRPIERGSPVKYTEVSIAIEDGDPQLLKPGMKGEARIVVGTLENAVVVPRSAVRGAADAPYLLVSKPGGPERRPVRLGLGDIVRVSVEDGLEGGERILLHESETAAPTPAGEAAGGAMSAGG